MQYILIADDNEDITNVLEAYARKEGFDVVIARDGLETLSQFRKYNPAAILLDVMMPHLDGYEVCRKIREKSNVPILLVTARGEDEERIMGLDLGADDYIVKPFSPNEVMARLRAVLRRINVASETDDADDMLTISNLQLSITEYTLYISGTKIPLTKKEIETMYTLAKHPGRVFTRDNLLDCLWGEDFYGDSRTIDSHIKRLRAKIDKVEHPDWRIKTVWGVGYKFEIVGNED